MKKNYIQDSEAKNLFEILEHTEADDVVSSSDDENQDKKEDEGASKPVYGLANEDVPADMKEWIVTPQKVQGLE